MKTVELKKMKCLMRGVVIGMIFSVIIGLNSCGPDAKSILKKYDTYIEVKPETNKAGISIEMQQTGDIVVTCSDSLLQANEANMKIISERLYGAIAGKPDLKTNLQKEITTNETIVSDTSKSVKYSIVIKMGDIKDRFLFIGFEGISPNESKELETPPLFFLVENKKGESKVLTHIPRLEGNGYRADLKHAFFSDQVYSGTIPFANSKDVVLLLTLSSDLTKVTKFELSADKLFLLPIKKNTGIASSAFHGGFHSSNIIDIKDDKIKWDDGPIICDLTVTNACIYGGVKIELWDSSTQTVYAVLKNTTTPQDIPEDILKTK